MNAAVLPRSQARRKKIKPPGPSFWFALAWVLWDVIFAGWDVWWCVDSLNKGDAFGVPFFALIAALMVWLLAARSWPNFRRELAKWKADQ